MTLQHQTLSLLSQSQISLNKRLGQNFLISDKVFNKIAEASELDPNDIVLEIGAGFGIITSKLASMVKHVYAIEIDPKFYEILSRICSTSNATLLLDNALEVDLVKLLKGTSQLVKVIANLPYYITTPLLMKLIEHYELFESYTLMVQKEVGQRIVAEPNSKVYGALTLAVKYRCQADIIANVPAKSFIPKPDVDSLLLKIVVLDKPAVEVKNEKLFFQVIKAAFGQRRKMLKNALELSDLKLPDKDKINEILTELNIDPKRRGETLSIFEFALLANRLEGKRK